MKVGTAKRGQDQARRPATDISTRGQAKHHSDREKESPGGQGEGSCPMRPLRGGVL